MCCICARFLWVLDWCAVVVLLVVCAELQHHSLFTLCWCRSLVSLCTKPCTDTACDKQKTESSIIQYDTWLHTQFPELLMMSEWRSKHVEHYHQIKSIKSCISLVTYIVSQEECARLREGVPYVEISRYNPKHLCPKLNGYGDNGQRSLKLWQLLHTYWLKKHIKTGRNMWFL